MLQLAVDIAADLERAGIALAIVAATGTGLGPARARADAALIPFRHHVTGVDALITAFGVGTPWDRTGWQDDGFLAALRAAEATDDLAARREAMAILQMQAQDFGALVQPVWRSRLTTLNRRIRGFRPNPDGAVDFASLHL